MDSQTGLHHPEGGQQPRRRHRVLDQLRSNLHREVEHVLTLHLSINQIEYVTC